MASARQVTFPVRPRSTLEAMAVYSALSARTVSTVAARKNNCDTRTFPNRVRVRPRAWRLHRR
jgi:hypothetical protein